MIELYEETESTNDLALAAAAGDAPHGACWVADRQTRGRGSREIGGERREWFSPPASNIYMSVLLRPDLAPPEATHMTLATALGVVDALSEACEVDVWIKWPNDLFVGDRKLAGILTEAETSGGELDGVVVGLGLNVNVASDEVPDHLADVMTSLRIETGRRWDRMPLLFGLRDGIVERCEDFARDGLEAVIDEIQRHDRTPGREVELRTDGVVERGIAKGIDDDGHLRVDVEGDVREIRAGEVDFA